jgi:hypothetical protein
MICSASGKRFVRMYRLRIAGHHLGEARRARVAVLRNDAEHHVALGEYAGKLSILHDDHRPHAALLHEAGRFPHGHGAGGGDELLVLDDGAYGTIRHGRSPVVAKRSLPHPFPLSRAERGNVQRK